MGMKKKLLSTIEGLREDGHDFKEHPPLFVWVYEEEPNLQFKLLISEIDPLQVDPPEALQ